MKKILSILLILSLAFTITACQGNADTGTRHSEPAEVSASPAPAESAATLEDPQPNRDQEPGDDDSEEEAEETGESAMELRQAAAPAEEGRQEDGSGETGKTLVVYISHSGTTAVVADYITAAITADVFEIVPVNNYPSNYNEHLDVAQQELSDDARPAIQSTVPNMDSYDTILLGYPIWWGHAPRPVATFLESQDLSGKTIAPFCTSGSSGMGRSADEIAQLAAGAEVLPGLSITSSTTGNAEELVRDWLSGLGLL